jgi:aryl-alcohol dehydrogenase-like predicted oxidoreductase
VPQDEQFDAIKTLQAEGLIRHVGLSEVSVKEIQAAQKYFQIATVQNRYNLADRASEDVLDFCEKNGIGFIPWYPLAAGSLTTAAAIDTIARRHAVTAYQVALAWLLRRSPAMLPIPGTSKVRHLEENVASAGIDLSDADIAALNDMAKA